MLGVFAVTGNLYRHDTQTLQCMFMVLAGLTICGEKWGVLTLAQE